MHALDVLELHKKDVGHGLFDRMTLFPNANVTNGRQHYCALQYKSMPIRMCSHNGCVLNIDYWMNKTTLSLPVCLCHDIRSFCRGRFHRTVITFFFLFKEMRLVITPLTGYCFYFLPSLCFAAIFSPPFFFVCRSRVPHQTIPLIAGVFLVFYERLALYSWLARWLVARTLVVHSK